MSDHKEKRGTMERKSWLTRDEGFCRYFVEGMLLVTNGLLACGVFMISKTLTSSLVVTAALVLLTIGSFNLFVDLEREKKRVVEITEELRRVGLGKEGEAEIGQMSGMRDLLDVHFASGLEPEGEPSSTCFSVEEFAEDDMEAPSRLEASIKARDAALLERAKHVRELQRENDFLEAEAGRLKLVAAVNTELRIKANEVHELEEENDDLEEVVDRLDSAVELNSELKETLKCLVEKLKKPSLQKLLSGLTVDDIDEISL